MLRRRVGFVAILGALAITGPAAGGVWQWGHNYVGPSVNPEVSSGFNYWADQYVHKHSGGWMLHGFLHTDGSGCLHYMNGEETHYETPSYLGCGGYLQNYLTYDTGASSYLHANSIT